MGMYTELVLKCRMLPKLPEDVKAILDFLFSGKERPDKLPEHEFFKCQRWDMIGRCWSFYHIPDNYNFYDGKYLFSRSDLKDYEYETEKFLDWVNNYLDAGQGLCIGWRWYEEWDEPHLILSNGKGHERYYNEKNRLS